MLIEMLKKHLTLIFFYLLNIYVEFNFYINDMVAFD